MICRILLLIKLTSCVCGQPQVIGSLQPIVAAPGDDVILPCHVQPQVSAVGLTVEWSKPDLKIDPNDRLSRVDYVYVYRHKQEVQDMQIPSFTRRTALFMDGLRRGNISLKITNVTLADGGWFRCFIPKLKSQTNYAFVLLVVEPNSTKTWTTETPLQPGHQPAAEETDVKGGLSTRSRLIPAVMFGVSVILFVGVAIYLIQKHNKQEELTEEPAV